MYGVILTKKEQYYGLSYPLILLAKKISTNSLLRPLPILQ